MHLTFAALAAVRHARLHGAGQEVEVSAVEAMLGAHLSTVLAWTHEGRVLQRAGCDLFRAKDGWFYFNTLLMNPNVFLLIEQPELMDDARWATNDAYVAHRLELWGLVEDWCRGKTVAEIVPVGQELRIPVTAVETAETLLADEHMRQRHYFRPIGTGLYPGSPLGPEPAGSTGVAPSLRSLLGNGHGDPPQPQHAHVATHDGEGPLAGLRILEMTHNWAGPIAARHFADLGADVIKVELATKPAARSSHYPGVDPGKYHWNRSGYFNHLNRNKRDIALNVATPVGGDLPGAGEVV
jgi:crotonobetainyl-CoA:carnitine CoA-transferase CaiB-like acyl-CoA transferase